MKLKHGKRYETAAGTVYKVRLNDGWVTFDVSDDSGEQWRQDGTGCHGTPHLIRRHYTKPKPADKLDLQPGDVVELCGWEDGFDFGVGSSWNVKKNGKVDSSHFGFYDQSPGEGPLFKIISRASWSK